jgi:hypothetical protein
MQPFLECGAETIRCLLRLMRFNCSSLTLDGGGIQFNFVIKTKGFTAAATQTLFNKWSNVKMCFASLW